MSEVNDVKKNGAAATALTVVGVAAGLPALWYAGNKAFFPVLVFVILLWIGDRWTKPATRSLAFAIYLQAADVLWLLLLLALPNAPGKSYTAAYVILTGIALLWLIRQPSILPAVLITALQAGFSVREFRTLMISGYGSDPHKVAVIHLLLRLLGVAAMYVGLHEMAAARPRDDFHD